MLYKCPFFTNEPSFVCHPARFDVYNPCSSPKSVSLSYVSVAGSFSSLNLNCACWAWSPSFNRSSVTYIPTNCTSGFDVPADPSPAQFQTCYVVPRSTSVTESEYAKILEVWLVSRAWAGAGDFISCSSSLSESASSGFRKFRSKRGGPFVLTQNVSAVGLSS